MMMFPTAMMYRGARARELFEAALWSSAEAWPSAAPYIASTAGYSSEYMVPLMAWMLHGERAWKVVDIGSAFCTFSFMAQAAGFETVAINPSWGPQAESLPFRLQIANALDREANLGLRLPGGDDAIYVCTEMVEHNDQNLMPGMKALFSGAPSHCFFTTPLAGTQGTPPRVGWMNMPEWDGKSEGSDKELSGWTLDDLEQFVRKLGYMVPLARGMDTCCSPVPASRLVVMGVRLP
jgi:hypothetical protein